MCVPTTEHSRKKIVVRNIATKVTFPNYIDFDSLLGFNGSVVTKTLYDWPYLVRGSIQPKFEAINFYFLRFTD